MAHGEQRYRWATIGFVASLAVGLPWVGWIVLTQDLDAVDRAVVLGFAVALIGLSPGFQTWKASRTAAQRERLDVEDVAVTVDKLARMVKKQWKEELTQRQLNTPYPLPVPWEPAYADLVDDLTAQRTVAANSPGMANRSPERWASSATDLRGHGNQLAEIFMDRIPARRMVVLGEPGSGKSVLLARLLLELLDHRDAGQPVPILFSMPDWKPNEQSLRAWMAYRICLDYPIMSNSASLDPQPTSRARALIDEGLILPILDGLDEIASTSLGDTLFKIIRGLSLGQPLIISSRTNEFRRALSTSSGVDLRIPGAAGIEVRPVSSTEASRYLRNGSENQANAPRWDPVIRRLGGECPVGQALRTPLTLFLASTLYNRTPAKNGRLPDPVELCDADRFPDASAIKKFLFHAYIPAVYQPRSSESDRRLGITPEKASRIFKFLARKMMEHDSTDFKWWELHHISTATRRRASLWIGFSTAVFFYVPISPFGVTVAAFPSLIMGVLASGAAWGDLASLQRSPTSGLTWKWAWMPSAVGCLCGLAAVEMMAQAESQGTSHGETVSIASQPFTHSTPLGTYITYMLLGFLTAGATCGWRPRKADPESANTPTTLMRSDRSTFRRLAITWICAVLVLATLFMLCMTQIVSAGIPELSSTFKVATTLFGGTFVTIMIGVPLGLSIAFKRTAWGLYACAKIFCFATGKTPYRLEDFLSDAHERGVLRQAGAVYQFRHKELRDFLAQ